MDGLMKGIVKTGVAFSIALVAALAIFYVLPAGADIILTSGSVTPASVNTKQNVTLNFSVTVGGGGTGINISVNVTGTGFTGLLAGNIVCPVNVSGGSQFNASVVNQDIATCIRPDGTANLTGAFNLAIKSLSAPVVGSVRNFTINVTGNDSTSNLTTISVTVLLLNANATLDTSSVNAGARQNYTFTVANNGTDPIDRINFTYDANFADPVAGDIVCPTTNALWNRSVDDTNNIITCTRADPPNDDPIAAGTSKTVKVENWSAPADARVKTFDVNVRGIKGGNFTVVSSKPSVNVFGNLTVTGISRSQTTNNTGTTNLTMIVFDINATGEQMNITGINITINGTIQESDIVRVGLYNSTNSYVTTFNETGAIDLLLWNNSGPVVSGTTLRYNFSNIVLNVNVSQKLLVVLNMSGTAVGGRTFNASIETAGDVVTTGGHSGQGITETLATQRSGTTMIIGTLSVAGTNRVASVTQIGTRNVTLMTFNLTAVGEQMNISEIIITRNGTNIADSDIIEVKLFNTTDPAATAVNSTQTPLAVNSSPTNGRYNFSGLSLRVPTGATGQILLVSFNISSSAVTGRTFNASIEGTADIVTNASTSGAAIAETLSGQRSSSSTITGNISIAGTSRIASTTRIGATNVTVISFNLTAVGEQMNITGINITINGTRIATADIARVGLYNSSAAAAGLLDGSGVNYDLIAWNNSAPVAGGGNTLRYNFSNIAFNIPKDTTNVMLVVVNLSSGATGGRTINASIEGTDDVVTTGNNSLSGVVEAISTARSSTSTIFGNLTISGTNRVAAQTRLGSNNVTIISFNFSAAGEQMNVSEIIVTRNGTVGNEDVVSVALYNSTKENAQTFNETGNIDPLAVNTSAPTANGRYNFSGLSLKVMSSQIVMVVFNLSSSANAGRTFNASIEGAADVATVGNASGVGITEDFVGQRSSTSTLVGMKVTGTSRVASTTQIGSKNVSIISFTLNASGENMNITGLNITVNGTGLAVGDINRLGLYNNTAANAQTFNETTYDLIQWNISAPVAGGGSTLRYNFSNIAFNITDGTINTLVVVVNLTDAARAGRTFNASIEGDGDAVVTGVSSGLAITETYASQRSSSSTIIGNISVTGTNIAPSAVDVGHIGAGILRLTLNATGEAINVSSINLTFNGTTRTDVLLIRLFNDTGGGNAGTYERGLDSPIAGASGVFAGSTVIITPTSNINVPLNSLYYAYVAFDVNTSATAGLDRLGVSVQGASAIVATGNDSYTSLTPQLITGDPGAVNVDIRNLTATATVITTGTSVARMGTGTINNFTFTINNTATGSLKDSIDEIRLLFGGTGLTLSGNATCPTISTITWNRTILSANTIVCNVTDSGGRLATDTNTTILVENFTASATASLAQVNVSVRGAAGGVFNITTANPAITVYGNSSVRATNRVNSTVEVGSTRITMFSMNLTAVGESSNVTEVLVTFNGSSLAASDIAAVELYNSTDPSAALVNGSFQLMRSNVTAVAPSVTFNFSGLNLTVPTGTTGQIVAVVVNISSSAVGGRTINATIISNTNMVSKGALTGIDQDENFTGQINSSTSTIFGKLAITGASRIASTTRIGSTNVTIISFNFTTTGEAVNITGLNITVNGTGIATADIARLGLYNSTAAAAGLLDGSGVNYDLIQWNISEPTAGAGNTLRYNFSSNIAFNISADSTNVLLVVVNLSSGATGGRTINASIEGAGDVISTSVSSGQSITETFTSQRSGTSTIFGNLTISGTNRVASQTRLGSSNVTIISFNFSAAGEQMNISEIIVTRNGTVGNEDVVSVAIYNSTKDNAKTFNETGNIDPLAVNTSAPTNGRYNFSGLSLRVPTGNIGQIVMVVFNLSSSANAGRTFNASIEGAADVATIGGSSGTAITEDFASQRSSTSTLVGMKVTGTSRVSATTEIGAKNVSVISFTLNASGENMNVTGLNITFNGTVTTADIVRVALYNSTAANAGVYNETTYDLIQWNLSAPVAGAGSTLRYNFSNIAINVTSGTINTLVVVVNISGSATGGRTFNASIEGDGDAVVTGVSSGLAITETYTSQRSSSSTLLGNLTVTGTSRVAAYTRLGSSNVTVISYNFSTTGELMNISEIIVTVNGSSISTADIVSVALYNSTKENAQTFNETGNIDPLAVNTSAPAAGAGSTLRYNFSGLSFRVPSSQIVMVVLNVSSAATGNRTFNASIESASDIATLGGVSNTSISETLATQRSGTSTLVSFNVSSASLSPNNISANQTATAMLNITITAQGESMNVTSFNFTLTGNATTGNITDVRLYRDDAAPLGAFTDADTYLSSRGTFNGNAIQLNLSATNYNLSISQGTTRFFVTFNVSGVARTAATAGVQLTPSGIAAVGNASGLAISVTGSSVASANSTVQSEASLTFGTITSVRSWITNKTTLINSTNISIPVTNGGASLANLTSVLITFLSEANAQNASSNFTVVRADSLTSVAGGVTTTLNFTVNATTGAQLTGFVNASVRLIYNDSNTYAAASRSPTETNTTALFGLDAVVPAISIVNPVLGGNVSVNHVDINFTLNDTGSGVNRSAIAISVNSVARNATCNPSGLNFTCNYSMLSSDSLFVFGSFTVRITNVTDNATNSASASEINFTLNNNDGVSNLTRPIVGADPYDLGWNTIQMPTQTMMEQQGRNASNTGDFNFTSLTVNLGTSWTHMYYNINGTSTGWVLATRTDFAGSTLKYLNNTNANPYWINMTARGMVFKI